MIRTFAKSHRSLSAPRYTFSLFATLGVATTCAALNAPAARAANFVVTSLNDSEGTTCGVDCSLRQAINAGNGENTNITFGVSGTIRLLRALPELRGTATINNTQRNRVTISGDANNNGSADSGDVRVFTIARAANVTFNNLSIRNGFGSEGGGIYNSGTLLINNSVLADNAATYGGAIHNNGGNLRVNNSTLSGNAASDGGGAISNNGTLALTNSTLSGNAANDGGGIRNYATLSVANSTFSGNTAQDAGGGIFNTGSANVARSTIANNLAVRGGGIAAAVYRESGTALNNSIVAGNSRIDGATGDDVTFTSNNSFTSGGYNLIGKGNALTRFGQAGDQTGVNDARLGPLQDNGGPTFTRSLLAGSKAINGGDPNAAPNSFDQRGTGFPRVRAGRMDIGAVELQVDVVPPAPIEAVDDNYNLLFGAPGQAQQAGVTLLSSGVFLIGAPGVLANDSDPSQGALTVALSRNPVAGRIQVRSNGSFYYLPNSGFAGVDEFTYLVSNGQTSSQAKVTLNIIDQRTPEVRLDTPSNGTSVKIMPDIKGRVRDQQSGVQSVTLLWQRFDGAYWNGDAWTANAVQLPLGVQGINWAYLGDLPAPGTDRARSLLDGSYLLTATATDNSGNTSQASSRFNVKNAPPASEVRLSSAVASAEQDIIVLSFTGALDATSANSIANYRVRANGVLVAIGAVTYANNSVTLSGLTLNVGDAITLQIGNLRDTAGKTLSGTIQLTAR